MASAYLSRQIGVIWSFVNEDEKGFPRMDAFFTSRPKRGLGPAVSLSLILPAYNEVESIGQAIRDAKDAIGAITDCFEIIVVDDGSFDETATVAERCSSVRVIRHEVNRGYGAAIRTGFEAAEMELVVFTDADRQFDLNELDRFLLLAADYDIVCGYRIDRQDPWLRCLYSKVYNVLVRALLGTNVRDIDCAFKLFRRHALSQLSVSTDGFLVNAVLLSQAQEKKLSIVEVGVTHRPREEGQSTVSVSHILPVLAALIRFWWNAILFPGAQLREPADRSRERSWPLWPSIALILCSLILLYANLSYPLFDRDETRYAEIPREMLVSGNWILPQLNFEPYYDKPPLFYWVCASSYRIFGVSEWSVRIVVATCGLATILLTLWFGGRMFGRRAGWLGATALLLSSGFLFCGRFLIIDALLTVLVSLSLFAAYEAIRGDRFRWPWWILAAGSCGLGVLAKGPIAFVLLAPPVFAFTWLTDSGSSLRLRHWLSMTAVSACVALPWFFAVTAYDSQFAYEFLYKHNVSRFAGAYHPKPFWFYVPVAFAGSLPWSFLAVPYVMFLCSRNGAARVVRSPAMGFLILWAGWCILFFSISGCKLPAYILPAAPAFALLVGHYLDIVLFGSTENPWFRLSKRALPWLSAVTTCLVGISLAIVALHMKLGTSITLWRSLLCWLAALTTLVAIYLRTRNTRIAWAVCALLALSLSTQVTHEWVPALGKVQTILSSGSSFTQWIRNSGQPLATYGDEWSGVPFYTGRNDIPNVRNHEKHKLSSFVTNHERSILVVPRDLELSQLRDFFAVDTTLRTIGVRGEARVLVAEGRHSMMKVASRKVPPFDVGQRR